MNLDVVQAKFLPEVIAVLGEGKVWPKGTTLSVCANLGAKANVEGRAWWGYPIKITVNGKSLIRYGVNLIKTRVNMSQARAEMAAVHAVLTPLFLV